MKRVTPDTADTGGPAAEPVGPVERGEVQPRAGAPEAEDGDEPGGPQVSARTGDLITGVLFVALGAFTLYAGRDLAFQAEFAAGPGFLPRILAIILIAAGGALFVKQFVRPSTGRMPLPSGPGAVKLTATLLVLLVAILVIEELGFILTAFLLLALQFFVVERKFTVAAVITAIALPVAFWVLFAVLLGARIPAGLVSF